MTAKFGLELDPAAIASKRAALNLNSGPIQTVGGEGKGIDWGEAAIKAFLSEGLYGESSTDFRIPNRQVTIPLVLSGATAAAQEVARRELEQKVALFQRQGGVLMRRRSSGDPLYADIVTASLIVPDVWESAVEANVVLKLECLPDFYGESIELDTVEENGQIAAVLQKGGGQALIAGDYPGRARLVLTDKSGHSQRGLLWGLRSLTYDATASAGLVIDAYTQIPLNGATTGVEGSNFSGKGVRLREPEYNLWHPMLQLQTPAGVHQTQVGTYRVWIRAAAPAGTRLRLVWSANDATAQTENAAMSFVGAGFLQLLDLGEIRIEEPPFGGHWWSGTIQFETGGTVHEVALDRIWLQPLDDGAGRLRASGIPYSTLLRPSKVATSGSEFSQLASPWTNPAGPGSPGGGAAVFSSASLSNYLVLNHLGFSVPSGAEIKGVEVQISAGCLVSRATLNVGLISNSKGLLTPVLEETLTPAGSFLPFRAVWGSSAYLWGGSLTPSKINAADFGISIYVSNMVVGTGGQSGVSVSYPAYVRVYYSIGASTITQDAVLYASQSTQVRYDGTFRADPNSSTFGRASEETGDLFRIPPSGIEGRACQLLVKQSRGILPAPGSGVVSEIDEGIDKIQAQVFYRPCYIGRI